MKKVTIHSDGGCAGNPGPGGWGAVLQYGQRRKELSGGAPATTNNRMELQAAIEGLRALKEPCEVRFFTDSQYLREGITAWVPGWKKRGWKTKGKLPVKNQELWMELDHLSSRHKIDWHWLKGHAGHKENERCDLLAQREMDRIRKTIPPTELKELLRLFKSRQQGTRPAEILDQTLPQHTLQFGDGVVRKSNDPRWQP